MAKKAKLEALSILIVDPDVRLAEVCAQALRAMGFGQVSQVPSAQEALTHIETAPVDILITEWPMRSGSGIALIQEIRHLDQLAKRILSIIMLTARAEIEDVKAARDAGINEFIVKPFTAKALFSRLEQLIEQPRNFVMAPSFVGPDRRRRSADAPEGEQRRAAPAIKPNAASLEPTPKPQALAPDHALRQKIELEGKLSDTVTPEIVAEAQGEIERFKIQSQDWIAEDIGIILERQDMLGADPEALDAMMGALLSLKARAGMFGHGIVSEVALLFYRFLRTDYRAGDAQHRVVVRKFADSLNAAFISNMTARDIKVGEALVQDLKRLSQKFADA